MIDVKFPFAKQLNLWPEPQTLYNFSIFDVNKYYFCCWFPHSKWIVVVVVVVVVAVTFVGVVVQNLCMQVF